ncbi:hypothetical protein M0R45_035569 [Rubus argutus]|uniref:F-box domain-containing protein n=1 Tax=Rubus argutus TaxID=59490 RepID=A0AAW1VWE1_RUBAR
MGTKRSRYSLDEDLILEIFSRLPAKSLMRFRCVSKEWYSLTKSSYLINIHLRRSDSKLCYLLAYTSFRDERFTKPKIGISRLGDEATDIVWAKTTDDSAWTKQFSIDSSILRRGEIFGIWKDQVVIWRSEKSRNDPLIGLFLYDPKTKKRGQWIPKHEVNNYYGYAKLVDYVESLVLV